jgi:hypothetical protein
MAASLRFIKHLPIFQSFGFAEQTKQSKLYLQFMMTGSSDRFDAGFCGINTVGFWGPQAKWTVLPT